MIQMWHWFAIGTVLGVSVSNLYLRRVMKEEENDPILFSIAFQFILTFIVLIFALYSGFSFPPPLSLVPRFIFGATLYAFGTLCAFYASKQIGAGEFTILSSSGSLITILLGVFLLGNSFGLNKALGGTLILASVIVLYAKEKMKISRGMWLALGVAVFYGVAVVNDVVILRTYNVMSFVPLMCFLPGFIILLMFPKRILKVKKLLKPKPLQHIVLYSLFYAVGTIFFYSALSGGATISQLSPISRASIIVTVILSAIFLGEKKELVRKIVSAILVSIGVILLA